MIRLLVTIITILLIGCSKKTDEKNAIYFVIKHHEKKVFGGDTVVFKPPFYLDHNFILVDTSKIFYHNYHFYYTCGSGIDFSKPPRLFLSADSINEIKIEDLPNFLQNSIQDSISEGIWVTVNISSFSDTIRNRALEIIKNHLESKNIWRYQIRNWTEEEAYTVHAKINNEPYDPRTAIFKIGFDTEFIPPDEP